MKLELFKDNDSGNDKIVSPQTTTYCVSLMAAVGE